MDLFFNDAWTELRTLRASQEVRPFRVAELANAVLAHPGRLGDDVWNVREQLAVALLDMGDLDSAASHVAALDRQFPGSLRVLKLKGMQAESAGDFETAMASYNAVIEQRESDVGAFKRKIALLKTRGRARDAIDALVTLLDTVPNDFEGWLELADLYSAQSMLQQAAFCAEEAILLVPTSHQVHLTYAGIQYALGAKDIALKHFCRAVELVPDFVPALYGVVQCTAALLREPAATAADKATWTELNKAVANKLSSIYAKTTVRGKDDSATVRAARAVLEL
ncbi:Inositol phosphatase SIW14 [Blastocladiella emersonii ATCC 22665]|nr:Inositol phosphatase SIW14 [Blastocladiella emersonii ATCC 22665]